MINDLRKFGANPTEGERAALAELQPSLLRTEKINRALIEKFMKIANRRYQGIAFLRDNPTATREDYLTFMETQYATDGAVEEPPATDDGPSKVFTFDAKGNLIQKRDSTMVQEVNLPDGSIARFPDGTPASVIESTLQKQLLGEEKPWWRDHLDIPTGFAGGVAGAAVGAKMGAATLNPIAQLLAALWGDGWHPCRG